MTSPRILWVLLAAALATAAAAEGPLRLRGGEIGPDGAITDAALEVTGRAGTSTTPLVVIDDPPIQGDSYQITGTVEHRGVEGEGYLELWSHFPGGARYFSRTLDESGPMAKLRGDSRARSFVLPFFLEAGGPRPTKLEVDVVLPAAGHVTLRDLRFVGEAGSSAPGAWWGPREAGLVGGIGGSVVGVAGALIGTLCSLGLARRLVETLLAALLVAGALGLAGGVVALALGQPYEVWYPLLLGGGIDLALAIGLRPTVRKRYEAAALRHVQAGLR
jgi:hypothetical protein